MSSELKNVIKNVTVYKVKVTNIRWLKTINGILSYLNLSKRVLHKCLQGFFYIKTNRQNHNQRVDAISTGK